MSITRIHRTRVGHSSMSCKMMMMRRRTVVMMRKVHMMWIHMVTVTMIIWVDTVAFGSRWRSSAPVIIIGRQSTPRWWIEILILILVVVNDATLVLGSTRGSSSISWRRRTIVSGIVGSHGIITEWEKERNDWKLEWLENQINRSGKMWNSTTGSISYRSNTRCTTLCFFWREEYS